jgi:hypothetical protein
MVFAHSDCHAESLVNFSGLLDWINLNYLIGCFTNFAFSVEIETSAKYEEFVLVCHCRVALSWLDQVVDILQFNFLPGHKVSFQYRHANFFYSF